MSDNSDQLAQLGEQVVAAITAAYNPHDNSTLALALHPGQALADDIVQAGVVNELRLSEWLAGQYDTPMVLKLADGTPVVTTTLGGVTAKSAYVTMARWGQPGVAADSAAYPRLAQLLSDVRQDVGEHPELLPFGCEPTDFALAECPAWQVFDTRISTHTSEETVTTAPGGTGTDTPDLSPPKLEIDPDLWKIRALSEATVAELPKRRRVQQEVQRFSQEMPELGNEVAVQRLQELRFAVQPEAPIDTAEAATLDTSLASVALADTVADRTSLMVADTVADRASFTVADKVADTASFTVADTVADTASFTLADNALIAPRLFTALTDVPARQPARTAMIAQLAALAQPESDEIFIQPTRRPPARVHLDATLAQELVQVNVADLADQPAVSTATTSDSSLHVHFEYVVLSITRLLAGRPWWHPEFLEEQAWFVPGMKRGALVPESGDPAYGHCLPQSLLLVRNVSLTGTWSDEAKATMNESVHYFGPFLMSPSGTTQTSTDAQNLESTTVVGLGVQVIGELCSALPALPPMDDPALTAH